MSNPFAPVIDLLHDTIKSDSESYESKIIHGTVISIDPLSIQLENNDDILPSHCFYPLDSVLVKKVRMIVHRMYGKPREIQFRGTANEFANQFSMIMFNEFKGGSSFGLTLSSSNTDYVFSGSGAWSASAPVTPPIDSEAAVGITFLLGGTGGLTTVRAANPGIETYFNNLSGHQVQNVIDLAALARGDVRFRVEFIEEEPNEPEKDEHIQNQTTAIEGIIWQGMRVDDVVLMSSHNHGQKYLIHKIINREREIDDYEQVNMWDSRINDIENVRNMLRVPTELPDKPF